jgi:hypothetical protein
MFWVYRRMLSHLFPTNISILLHLNNKDLKKIIMSDQGGYEGSYGDPQLLKDSDQESLEYDMIH